MSAWTKNPGQKAEIRFAGGITRCSASVAAILLAGFPAVASAQGNCAAMAHGPARTDCYLALSQFYRAKSDLAAAQARAQSDADAIKNAAQSGKLVIVPVHHEQGGNSLDWESTTINVESLCEWLRLRNYRDGFFIGGTGEIDKLADETGKFYAPKLAAAVRAWNEVTGDPDALNGKSPKRALEIWLRKHSNEYGLTNKDGNPNELGIEEICKVANWKPAGGASPTPTAKRASEAEAKERPTGWARKLRPPRDRANPPTRRPKSPTPPTDINDDIPF